MFQYSSPIPVSHLNYSYLPQMNHQYSYFPLQQLVIFPGSYFESNYDLLTSNFSQNQNKNTQKHFESHESDDQINFVQVQQNLNQNQPFQEQNIQKKNFQIKSQGKQKFGRNICSNIFHLMVKYIKNQKKLKVLVSRIIQQNKMNIKVNEFYQIFKNHAYKLKAYASTAKITQFWRGPNFTKDELSLKIQKEIECSKIFRILGRHYLTNFHVPYVYNSLKLKSQSKKLHMENIRKILRL